MFETVSQGQPVRFSARQFNSWNRTAETVQNGDSTDSGDLPRKLPSNPMLVTVRNNTGSPVGLYGILAIGKPLNEWEEIDESRIEALNHWLRLEGNYPTGSATETVCITLHPVDKDSTTTAIVVGPACCVVDIKDRSHQFAKPIDGNAEKMVSTESGNIKIITKPDEEGEAFCFILLGVGNAGEADQYAIVMETIRQSSDLTARPPDNMGKIALFRKDYPTVDENGNAIEPKYDQACCLELAESEVLLPGTHVKVDGPLSMKNPDFNADQEESENNPKTIAYYNAIETPGEYTEQLQSALEYSGSSTINVKLGEESETLTVYCKKLNQGQSLPSGAGVTVNRTGSGNGIILEVMLGPCPEEST